jgi:hypothetical protein
VLPEPFSSPVVIQVETRFAVELSWMLMLLPWFMLSTSRGAGPGKGGPELRKARGGEVGERRN